MDIAHTRTLCLLLFVLLIQGCAGGDETGDRSKVYPVTGKITLSGAPVVGAAVTFSPKGQQPVALGRTNDSGIYSLTTYDAADGASEGDYTVLVTKAGAPAGSETTPAPAHQTSGPVLLQAHKPGRRGAKKGDDSGSLLPSKYGDRSKTDLSATVKSEGENKFDFDLKP
jgi:hypothetical protein